MGIFDEKIKRKNVLDDEMFEEAFQKLAAAVTGKKTLKDTGSDRIRLLYCIEEIGKLLHIDVPYSSNAELTVEWYQEQYFRPQGIMWREVSLKGNWYENAAGVMLGSYTDGRPVVLIPEGNGRYSYRDPETGRKVRITSKNAGMFRPSATLYYRTLPLRKIGRKDIRTFILQSVSIKEILALVAATFMVMLLGMVTPAMTKVLMSSVIQTADHRLLTVILMVLIVVTAAAFFFTIIKQLLLARISTQVAVPVQAAFMMRILSVPPGMLKSFSAGDLGSRIGAMYSQLTQLLNMFLSMILTAVCSFVCFFQMFHFAPGPARIAVAVTVILGVLLVHVVRKQAEISVERMKYQAEESGLTYSLIDGMQKICLAGAQKRAFATWARVFQKSAQMIYDPPFILKIYSILIPVILLAGTIFMYLVAARSGVSPADFFAFLTSYGILTGAMTLIGSNISGFANALPVFRFLRPVMDLVPEVSGEKEVVQRIKGNISFKDVTFSYTDQMPPVLENLNMEIRQGEYVAITGATGCGKSTVMKLMLGFEKPDHGSVCFDGRNLNSVDVQSLRRNIGVVLQNGEIFRGTVFSNIVISGTNISEEDAWNAAKIAGIADDIRRMPMQMNTPLPDGGRGVSGGQKQRLLIARAIASKPSVLIFDEATSALDNMTQKAVSDQLGELNCTRIVIAHRLSTVQNCDRILVLDDKHIAEEGTFEELMKRDGVFANLVRRQQI